MWSFNDAHGFKISAAIDVVLSNLFVLKKRRAAASAFDERQNMSKYRRILLLHRKNGAGGFFWYTTENAAFSDRLVPRPTTASFRVGKPRSFCKKNTVNFEKSVNSIDKQGKTGYYILAYQISR